MPQTQKITEAIEALSEKMAGNKPTALVGFDGFLDEICEVVDQRINADEYIPFKSIEQYSKRVATAAGKSTNLEFVIKQHKMGGNGPLLSDALGRLGTTVCSVGAFGEDAVHAVYQNLGDYGRQVSLCDTAVTIATEFEDGKIMHGMMSSLKKITPETIFDKFGSKEKFVEELDRAQLVAALNWTMIPNLTSVFECIADVLKGREKRMLFFDLCDPAKRPKEDLKAALGVMTRIQNDSGQHVILGLNEKESDEVCQALGIESGNFDYDGMMARAKCIREALNIEEVVIHPVKFAAVSSATEGEAYTVGPVSKSPKITTGAGDHFNGGYCYGRMLGVAPKHAIVSGVATSGYYVRNAHGPSQKDLLDILTMWESNTLSDLLVQ